uniref:Neutrophil cytosolic factor 2 n=1 Tax=Bubo bubo TaxID=30461 RepID=A0A8C0ENI7_BUBBB
MSLVETIRLWQEGVCAADGKEWKAALDAFTAVQNPPAKICFNIGCIHLVLGKLAEAEEQAFTRSISCDKHLAVAYFQRGTVFYRRQKRQPLAEDGPRQVGTPGAKLQPLEVKQAPVHQRYKLISLLPSLRQILYNIALVYATLEDWKKAEEHLTLAMSLKSEPQHIKIDRAMQAILVRRSRSYSRRVCSQQGGGIPVVASVVDKDDFSGFAPLQPQVRHHCALKGQPHRVLYEFVPETAEELQVLPGNIVFVLKKEKDNWATVMFNGKKGIVPCNYLEPVELQNKLHIQVRRPRRRWGPWEGRSPHIHPPLVMGLPAGTIPATPSPSLVLLEAEAAVSSPRILKVHYKYTIALQVEPGLSYAELLDLVCKKLELQPKHTQLRYKPAENQALVTLSAENLEAAWSQSKDNCLTVWCDMTEVSDKGFLPDSKPEELPLQEATVEEAGPTQVVAQYDYEATQPEDLEFQAGDVILVLSQVNEDWLEGQCNGKIGIFPSAFVQKSNTKDPEM